MANKIQLRRGTAAQWILANPILASGEPGFETDTQKQKTGDGVTAWNALRYLSASEPIYRTTPPVNGTTLGASGQKCYVSTVLNVGPFTVYENTAALGAASVWAAVIPETQEPEVLVLPDFGLTTPPLNAVGFKSGKLAKGDGSTPGGNVIYPGDPARAVGRHLNTLTSSSTNSIIFAEIPISEISAASGKIFRVSIILTGIFGFNTGGLFLVFGSDDKDLLAESAFLDLSSYESASTFEKIEVFMDFLVNSSGEFVFQSGWVIEQTKSTTLDGSIATNIVTTKFQNSPLLITLGDPQSMVFAAFAAGPSSSWGSILMYDITVKSF